MMHNCLLWIIHLRVLSLRWVLQFNEANEAFFSNCMCDHGYFVFVIQAREPKATLRLDEINAVMVPEKVGNPNAMQITCRQDGSTRSLFLYAESGKVSS